ncbi:hypothetical protein V6N12_067548 [Hibiscus sabdariffa]|uniref:Uncharacterized protein n=1 Tax=Hibiscus sabdariffa TaxID=183260 RepID=A0ABR2B859_9ROSI
MEFRGRRLPNIACAEVDPRRRHYAYAITRIDSEIDSAPLKSSPSLSFGPHPLQIMDKCGDMEEDCGGCSCTSTVHRIRGNFIESLGTLSQFNHQNPRYRSELVRSTNRTITCRFRAHGYLIDKGKCAASVADSKARSASSGRGRHGSDIE